MSGFYLNFENAEKSRKEKDKVAQIINIRFVFKKYGTCKLKYFHFLVPGWIAGHLHGKHI